MDIFFLMAFFPNAQSLHTCVFIVMLTRTYIRSTSLRLTGTFSIQENRQFLAYQHVCISILHLTGLNIATYDYEAPLKSSVCGSAIIRRQCAKPVNPKLYMDSSSSANGFRSL